jgi:hypothetical protein
MKIKTPYLTDIQLRWAVAIALGWAWKIEKGKITLARPTKIRNSKRPFDTLGLDHFLPTKSWSIAGPIIEREKISVMTGFHSISEWRASQVFTNHEHGPTPLVAAMRCFVTSKLGDEVDVPEELCPPTA